MMAGLEDVEAWLDASDKNGVSVANSILILCSTVASSRVEMFIDKAHLIQICTICTIYNWVSNATCIFSYLKTDHQSC